MHATSTAMDSLRQFLPKHDINKLDGMTFTDLETVKQHIDTVRKRILELQNSQSRLIQLPGELRNRILLFAMNMELRDRRKDSRHSTLYSQPAFFAISRQLYIECRGLWFHDVLVWEEFDSKSTSWRRLDMEEIRSICTERSKTGKLNIITQPAHCDLGRTRGSVECSRSICPRKGLVRVHGDSVGLPQMRWWVW